MEELEQGEGEGECEGEGGDEGEGEGGCDAAPEPGVGQEEVRGGSIGRGALPGQTGIYVLLKY